MTVLMSITLEKCLQYIKHWNCAAALLIGSTHQEIVAQENMDSKRTKTYFTTYKPLSLDMFNGVKKNSNRY